MYTIIKSSTLNAFAIVRPNGTHYMPREGGIKALYTLRTATDIVKELNYALKLGTKNTQEDNLFNRFVGKRRGNETLFEAIFGKE